MLYRIQSGPRLPAEMNESASSGDGGSANASPAMNADMSSGFEEAGQFCYESPEGFRIRWNMNIWNGIREKLHSKPLSHRAFFCKPEHSGFIHFKEGNQSLNSALLHSPQFVLQPVIPARP